MLTMPSVRTKRKCAECARPVATIRPVAAALRASGAKSAASRKARGFADRIAVRVLPSAPPLRPIARRDDGSLSLRNAAAASIRVGAKRAVAPATRSLLCDAPPQSEMQDAARDFTDDAADSCARAEAATVELRLWWQEALQELTPPQRRVMELRLHGLTEREIAKRLNITQPAVCKAQARARKTLQSKWGKDFPG